MLRTILVPLDGSHFAEHSLPLAFSIARRTGASVHLLRVQPPLADLYFWAPNPGDTVETQLLEQYRKETLAYLDQVSRQSISTAGLSVTTATMVGDATESIQAFADEIGADLVVMTTHGRGMLERFWLGSVADELVRSLTIPLMLVRPSDKALRLDQEISLKRIVIALDGTAFAEKILEPALAIGGTTGAEYTLLRVVSAVPRFTEATHSSPPELELTEGIERIEARLRHGAEAYLQKVAAGMRARGLTVQTHVHIAERPAVAILEEIAKSADLVALETHGRHGLARLLLGSVTDKVVRGTSLPVLVCHSIDQKQQAAPAAR